ncbi:ARM repeat-containing protein [Lentinus tigrinus ALCF2SS1-7]|uniref:ARM repeat-containing protein n=1 Tax=Lentinus tigrinus ALCF2SS1-6 TaxID=1328759 RepID=A0A5C2S3D9_9APHY|nr:ARM repeat-containing protein [Lentinus tigrinus ALCF2SS1-6]RPD72015.1 ARM repeat-containing protein [Lentinus tigrinus ALCF2SS1-7]
MGRSEIESWLASTTTSASGDDNDSAAGSGWRRENILKDWSGAMRTAQTMLFTSSTKARVRFLREELLVLAKHGDLSLSQIMDVFKLLTSTYPRYVDAESREAVEEVGVAMVRRDELRGTPQGEPNESKFGVAEQVLGWMSHEVGRIHKRSSSHAAADMFVLLNWCCGLYVACLECNPDFPQSRCWTALLGIMASLVDMILDPSTRSKKSLQKSARVRTRRALRYSPENLHAVMKTLLELTKSLPSPLIVVPLLGISVDVTLRLKHVKDESLKHIDTSIKNEVIQLYTSAVLMSRTPVPAHISSALHDFIQSSVTPEDFSGSILPAMEKALLRSPEISLSVIADFLPPYSHPVEGDAFRRLLNPALNSAKSSNHVVRSSSVALFNVLIKRTSSSADLEHTVNELLSLPKAGKTAGPDHRLALYTMLGAIPPSESVSTQIVQTSLPLLAKETHDASVAALGRSLIPHLVQSLRATSLPGDITTVAAKEMTSTKPVVRRAFCSLVGSALWEIGNIDTAASASLAKAAIPSLETNLKTVSGNPLNAVAGPLEGYVATAILLGPLARSKQFDDVISHNATLQSISTAHPKPSFLLWDKVYQKLSGEEEETWLLRASEAVLVFSKDEVLKDEHTRTSLGSIFLHLAVEGSSPQIRRSTLSTVERLASTLPEHINLAALAAASTYFSREKPRSKATAANDEQDTTPRKEERLPAFFLACTALGEDCPEDIKARLLWDWDIVAHHPGHSGNLGPVWIELCQKAKVDPHDLVTAHADIILDKVFSAIDVESKPLPGFTEAGFRAITTLAFVAPDAVLPRVIDKIRTNLKADVVQSLTEDDLGIWATPEGQTYVDVLASKKEEAPVKKGKGYKDAQWEAEVRKSIASKHKNTTLSKQDQALVQAQLEKEAIIRQRIAGIKAQVEQGLHLVRSLVAAEVEQIKRFVSDLSALLRNGAFGKAVTLVGEASFETYLMLSECCSERLDTYRKWVGVATLRSFEMAGIPEDFTIEPLNSLVIRVLYRLRTLSEQSPFDAATYGYASPLLSRVLLKGGIAIEEEDDPLEQIALSLDIIKFHCGEFFDPAFPRTSTVQDLIHVIRHQPKLAKDASSALIDIGQAMQESATKAETSEFLLGTLYQEVYVRTSCLQALQPFDLTEYDWSPELWIAYHDEDEQNARLANRIWEDNGLDVPETFLPDLLPYLEHENAYVRSCSASAVADAVIEYWPGSISRVLLTLEDFYRERAKVLAPEFDQYGMLIASSVGRTDPWPARVAVSRAFELLAPAFTPEDVEPFFKFLIQDQALGDRNADVRRGMLRCGTTVIDLHGSTRLPELIVMFEAELASTGPATEASDQIKEAVVILIGRLARHLDPSDSRLPSIVERLVGALKTPAEQVQIAVSECLSPLVKVMKAPPSQLVDRLLDELCNSPSYAARRGAAYGLAGVVKGLGISSIKEYDIIDRLRAAAEDKKRFEPRQGAMFAFETFTTILGRLFEPYVIHILPLLLNSFGDGTPDVREATQDTARVIMANMSGYGLKTVLPSLLSGLDEKQWRTKKGSIELLGMMAYCAPKQLSQSLPIVIPRLTGVLTDSHAQVRAAANKSLKQFGEVISNPEIQSLVPVFLKAMVDPAKTPNALTALIKTSFMHYIDHSSLALVIPIIERGLRERGADTKKKAAQIVGNLASLTDSKDFVPYLSRLLPLVHVVLVDPVPEARATAAKALGTLVERLGEVHFPDLVPGLLRTLKTDTSGVDRQGAAQGLSEVLAGLGMERMEGLLPDIIANAQSPRSTVREGFMSLLVFLPATFGARFQPHLPKIIPPILSGLSDSEDYVREAAMRAGRMMVNNYSSKAIDLLLPELERGMFDPGWRIRQSSITLVGELLFKVSGISGKAEIEEDEEVEETALAETSRKALVEVLGQERRDRILSALYLARQDSVNVVRQSSVHIWKALVHNTPRTVREILPELTSQIIQLLTSDEIDQQETGGRTVTELCRKSGEKLLSEVVAILRNNANSPDARKREGVCLMLCELMVSTTDNQREGQEDAIIQIVRASLVDDEANVRSAAAKAFDTLQEHIGARAIDETIPTLLEALRQPGQSSGTALQALKEVMAVRASTVFPILIPTLTAIPMSAFNARALASLVTVAGSALSRRLTVILNALVKMREGQEVREDEELNSAVDEAIRALMASISDPEGLNTLMLLLLEWAKHDQVKRRVSSCELFAIFCEETDLDSSLYRVDWIRQLVSLLDDREVAVHTAAWNALDVFVKSIPKDELEPLVVTLRRTIESTGAPGTYVPGFSLPKGVSPTVPIIIAGLTTGSNEQREQAAYAIGDLVERTEESAIKPFVVPFTGPLIRVATQATTYPPAVKTAILSALTTMLERIPTFVKPFFPQLQRTFVKSASDPASLAVRSRAARALGVLMKSQPRVDPVVTELVTGAKSNEDEIAASLVLALSRVVRSAGANVGEKAREACAELITEAFKEQHEDTYYRSVAAVFAALSIFEDLVKPIITAHLVAGTPQSVLASHCIRAVVAPDEEEDETEGPNVFQKLGVLRKVAQKAQESAANEKPSIARPAREARDALKASGDDALQGLF